jgi:hypothetical protein
VSQLQTNYPTRYKVELKEFLKPAEACSNNDGVQFIHHTDVSENPQNNEY